MMRKSLAALTCVTLLGSCSSALDADANGIWLQESMINVTDLDAEADEHCRKYGKRAVYRSTLRDTGTTQYMMPIRAYNCVAPGESSAARP